MEKLKIKYPCIVEGKYDKIKHESVIEGRIIQTAGFGVFSDREKTAMLRALAEKTPLIVATDSDGGGLVIRNYMKSIIPKERLFHVYIPEIKGKEKRKTEHSKAGILGLEGMSAALLRELFAPYAQNEEPKKEDHITKSDFYLWGLSGGDGSAERRKKLCKELALPTNLSANAMLDIIDMLYDREFVENIVKNIQTP